MSYLLLTGATGLLGNYLLRDLLRAERQVAVVVRPSRLETARQRVDGILTSWERSTGRALARPPVLAGDICQPEMGLGPAELQWIRQNCDALLHNAASLSFEADEKTGEPYRSNVEGTRNVLDVCRQTGIRQFHHVSTAYVCGLRTGRILEDELDVRQQSGNAYEKSKIEAEKLVRGAAFLDEPTFYRPAIIIGDSQTGYTTTFHGFYTPLKIVHAFADRAQIDGSPMLAALDLSGSEKKNYVPVDWVSRVIAWLSGRPEHRGRTYHLTPRAGVPMSLTCQAIEQALREGLQADKMGGPGLEELVVGFMQQMETYRAYWRDDPQFDAANTHAAAPHLPCPDVDLDMLVRTARYALECNFGWPRPQPVRPEFDVWEHLSRHLAIDFGRLEEQPGLERCGLQVSGPGGGQWTLTVDAGRPIAAKCGLANGRQASAHLNSRTFERLTRGETTLQQAYEQGELAIEGSAACDSDQMLGLLAAVLGGSQPARAARTGLAVGPAA